MHLLVTSMHCTKHLIFLMFYISLSWLDIIENVISADLIWSVIINNMKYWININILFIRKLTRFCGKLPFFIMNIMQFLNYFLFSVIQPWFWHGIYHLPQWGWHLCYVTSSLVVYAWTWPCCWGQLLCQDCVLRNYSWRLFYWCVVWNQKWNLQACQ